MGPIVVLGITVLRRDMDIQKEKVFAATLSVISNSLLVVFKATIGILIGSVSVLSEAIHSGIDLVAAIIASFAVRTSARPADEGHPFGHGKVENISAAVEALLIFVAAIWIIYEAIHKLLNPSPLEAVDWGILIMLISALANIIVSRKLFDVGRKSDSAALIADGWHLRTDVYTSVGVMAALAIICIGARFFPSANLFWIDPIAAILVAFLILRAAYQLTASAIEDLLDRSAPKNEKTWMETYLRALYPTVRSVHRFRTRKSGPIRFIDCHIVVDPNTTVSESHKVTDKILSDFKAHFPNVDLTLHVEPCEGLCSLTCKSGCLLSENEKKALMSK